MKEASKIFDTNKVQQLTSLLEKLPENFSDVYIIPEVFFQEAATLFKRLKLPVRAVMHDTTTQKDFWGIPVIKTAEAVEKFNERMILIVLTQKPVPFIQTTFDIKKQGGTWTVSALVMTNEEAQAVYDRVLLMRYINSYVEDGISPTLTKDLPDRFSRGLTTFLEPRFQNFKYQLWDSRAYFKPTYTFNDTAIVIQGPIEYANNYTAETFKFYRSIYPNVPIVVSTWKGEATNDFRRECRENSVVLLENEPPKVRGGWNVNMQIKSSFCGVEYVRENTSAKFVLKTRTDQRINRFDFLVYFKNLLETFPPKDDKLQQRIILSDSAHDKTFPFHFCDFLSFGCTSDILKFYDVPLHKNPGESLYALKILARLRKINVVLTDNRCPLDYNFRNYPSPKLRRLNRILHRTFSPERHVAKNFYEKNISLIDPTKFLETSWKFAADYLILIDFEAIQLDWPKYEWARYKMKFFFGIVGAFSRWLDIYRNFKID